MLATTSFVRAALEESAYGEWVAGFAFPPGSEGPGSDPDGDGVANLMEFLFGGDPLVPGSATQPTVSKATGGELGVEAYPEKQYLTLTVRVRKDREGVVLIPQAAFSVEGLNDPEASDRVGQAGPPVPDGEFEVITYYFTEPIDGSPGGRGFIRLMAVGETP
jgi:hypothetical protein